MIDCGGAIVLIEAREKVFPSGATSLLLGKGARTFTRPDTDGLAPASLDFAVPFDLVLVPAQHLVPAAAVEVALLLESSPRHVVPVPWDITSNWRREVHRPVC